MRALVRGVRNHFTPFSQDVGVEGNRFARRKRAFLWIGEYSGMMSIKLMSDDVCGLFAAPFLPTLGPVVSKDVEFK